MSSQFCAFKSIFPFFTDLWESIGELELAIILLKHYDIGKAAGTMLWKYAVMGNE